MELLHTLAALIVTLGILVTIHEWGHFWVARRCGVKVLRFSVGFGKPLWQRTAADGCTYQIAAIPLGGYVKFLDEHEGGVDPSERHRAFNTKPVGQRFAIVAAGPLVNLIFAVFAYAFLFAWGETVIKPTVGSVAPNSLAEQAQLPTGSIITEIDGRMVRSWEDINLVLANRVGDSGTIELTTQLDGVENRHTALLDQWSVELDTTSPIRAFGIQPWRPDVQPVLGELQRGGPAEQAGLEENDTVLSINDQSIAEWADLVAVVQGNPNIPLAFVVERLGARLELVVTPAQREEGGQGFIGAGVQPIEWPEDALATYQQNPVDALVSGFDKTGQMIGLTLNAIKKIITGLISVDNLSGPITIAKIAGQSAASGMESFITFLAYLSVSLGVLNLLPIPMLDGGHLVYYIVEVIQGKPVSDSVQQFAARIGIAILGTVMTLAIYNDLMRI